MDMNYDILSYDELPADEAAMLKADAEEAERGYTDEQLSEALKRTPGRPLAVGSTPASNVIRVRLDDERDAKLERYMRKHHMSRSNAVRTLLDKALAEIVAGVKAGKKAVISGFVDSTGNAEQNAELAKLRALAVREQLKALGVTEDQVELKKPGNIDAGASAEARRVEVSLG